MIPTPTHKAFEKAIRSLAHRHHLWQVFADFCEMTALVFAQGTGFDDARERRYLDIIQRYEPDEQKRFPELLGITTEATEGLDCDFLGEVFQDLELASHWHGQFFTPYALTRLMAEMQLGDAGEIIAREGFITLHEPACGAGAMVIACARTLLDRKINYQQTLHVTAVDVDATAAHMAYIQFTLLHIPAVVIVGNTLTLETRAQYKTLAHVLGGWDYKLAMRRARDGKPAEEKKAPVQRDIFEVAA